MTKPNFTAINIILDRSGSMGTLSEETIISFNKFLREQQAASGDAVLTLATFASDYRLVYDFMPLKDVPELTAATYQCNGWTALNEAVCRCVDDVGRKLASMREEDRPSKVLTIVITDGQENKSSKQYTLARVKETIEHQTLKYQWVFAFLGSDPSTFAESKAYGVSSSNTRRFAQTKGGIGATYSSLSANTTAYRSASAADIGEAASFDFFKKDVDGLTKDKESK